LHALQESVHESTYAFKYLGSNTLQETAGKDVMEEGNHFSAGRQTVVSPSLKITVVLTVLHLSILVLANAYV
jgi:hypothetical protein